MTVTVTLRRAASAVIASIWVRLPSTRASQVRRWPGSRRSASPKAAAMTAGMSSVTEAVSHFPAACGPRMRSLSALPGGAMMSSGVRGTGTAS